MLDILELLCNTEVEGGSVETTEPVNTEVATESTETATESVEPVTPSTYSIDGEELTVEQIRELRTNSKSYQDILAEQQKISKMNEEHKDAIELFNYLKGKPELTQKLYELDSQITGSVKSLDPMAEKIASMENRFRMMDVERQLDSIINKDSSVTKGELLKEATESRCDINTAYNIWKGKNLDKILKTRLDEQSKKLTQQIKTNSQITKTAISSGDTVNKGDATHGLSDIEQAMAKRLGMDLAEYAKWKV